jgi:hypothetical protein
MTMRMLRKLRPACLFVADQDPSSFQANSRLLGRVIFARLHDLPSTAFRNSRLCTARCPCAYSRSKHPWTL